MQLLTQRSGERWRPSVGRRVDVESFVRALRDGFAGHGRQGFASGFARTFGLVNPAFVLPPVAALEADVSADDNGFITRVLVAPRSS